MTFDFPNSPTTNQLVTTPNGSVFSWDGVKWIPGVSSGSIGGGASVTISDSVPSSPKTGDMWWDSIGTQLYLRYNDGNSIQWVPATNQTALASVTVSDTAPASPKTGDMWFDSVGTQLYLRYNDGNSSQWVSATNLTTGVTEAPTDGYLYARRNAAWSRESPVDVGRNCIHNPLMNIWQRGAVTFTANSAFTADRWRLNFNSDTAVSVVQSVLSDAARAQISDEAARYALQTSFTGNAAAAAYTEIMQAIEGVYRLSGKTVILSFWATASTALKVGINGYQQFGTGGSPSGPVGILATGIAVQLSTTWTRYSVVLPVPSAAGKTLGTNGDDNTVIQFFFSSGATNNQSTGNIGVQSGSIALWGVQLEIAQAGQTLPTILEKPDPQQDLAKCQRFYQRGIAINMNGYATAAGQSVGLGVSPFVPMRASPTLSIITNNNVNLGTTTLYSNTFQAVAAVTASVAIGAFTLFVFIDASADL